MLRLKGILALAVLPALLVLLGAAQQQIPDAPSTTRPPQQTLPTAPPPRAPEPPAPGETPPAPSPTITNVPAGQPSAADVNDPAFTIRTAVNFVVVPVTVKDSSGHLVDGLLKKDFSVHEDGVEQQIRLFTSDPFPLSAAIVLDLGMSDITMHKINQTLSALAGAFSQFDEVAFYTFGSTVERTLDFSTANDRFAAALKRSKHQGRTGGVPVVGGPLGSGPSINGRPADPSTPHVNTPRRESRVLNDAILAAAMDLAKRDRARRRIIFVVSDGREEGSRASYNDVLKVLLSHGILIYAVAVDESAIPGYRKLESVRLPRMGYGNLLPKYAGATGGEVFPAFDQETIEATYQRLTSEARNQYTLGYTTRATAASNYRQIEVVVHRSGLSVHAKDGYYPLPTGSSATP